MIQCDNCGYLVISGMHTCPNCLAEMPDEVVAPIVTTEENWCGEDEIPYCSLQPISLLGEKEMVERVYDEGAEVYLSRQNTISHDKSIDDEEQACLFFSDGHWFIEDRSRDNSTYVHAGAGIKLEPGDIIRMGDRLFVFNIKTRNK